MIRVEGSVGIERPVGEVFSYVTDPTNDPNWLFDVLESTASSDGPIGVGSRIRWVVKFMGKRENSLEVTRFEPEKLMEFKVHSGAPMGLRPKVTYQLAPANGATKFTRKVEMQAQGAARIMEPLMGVMARRYNTRFLANLKNLMEQAG